ncbi:hypothetical protein RI129_006190 [Pyrocoelia pectoralis]|uniref:MORN repeat-containing protein 3 n=1 Tax=Pyrocoelia pectoralis TaxID=417401 RepID=A0AAN7VAA4_9COLE
MPFLKDKEKLQTRSKQLIHLSNKNGARKSVYNIWNDKYVGEWKDNIKKGKGACLTRTQRLYEGDWKDNFRDGYGVFCLPKEDNTFILEYRGEWKKGLQCGFGQKHYKDKGYYLGNLKNSKRHGWGEMWYSNGGYYIGHWENDLRHGGGMWVRSDGNRYEGSWNTDLKHGKGRFFHLNTGQMQEGVWKTDICIYSVVVDIPYRQSAVLPTPYPIPIVMLQKPNEVCADEDTKMLFKNSMPCEHICCRTNNVTVK